MSVYDGFKLTHNGEVIYDQYGRIFGIHSRHLFIMGINNGDYYYYFCDANTSVKYEGELPKFPISEADIEKVISISEYIGRKYKHAAERAQIHGGSIVQFLSEPGFIPIKRAK